MEKITSRQNEYIKELKKLQQAKYRKAEGKFLVESDKCVREALLYAEVESVLFKEGADISFVPDNIRKIEVTEAILEYLSEAKTPQGLICVVKYGEQAALQKSGFIIALEDISDPTNLGAIIRTADAVGAKGIVISENTCDYRSQRAVRAAMGSTFHVPVYRAEDIYATVREYKEAGFEIVGAHLKGSEEMSFGKDVVLLIGNESRGLSKEISSLCTSLVRIPMRGKAESLNASVAAGILMYKIAGL